MTIDQTGRTNPVVGLVRLTVHAPARRLDVTLPAHVPLAELLPTLLRHAGDALADLGERHGGWLLRRATGEPLNPGAHLYAQGIRDGAVVHLVPAGDRWPELEFDDVAEAIADSARRHGAGWSAARTRQACLAAAGVLLAVPLLAALSGAPAARAAFPLLALTAVLAVAGVVAARAYGDGALGAALVGYAAPYAFVGGGLAVAADERVGAVAWLGWLGAPQLLLGGVAAVATGVVGLAGVARAGRASVAVTFAGAVAAAGGLAGYVGSAATVAAVALAALVCGIGLVPLAAIRLGKVPVPPLAAPDDGAVADAPPDRVAVGAAVARTAALLAGLLAGHAAAVLATVLVLLTAADGWGRALAAVAGVALLLRARLFAAVAHRVPVLVAGLGALALVGGDAGRALAPGAWAGFTVGVVAVALVVALAGAAYATRAPSPYLGRLADVLDTASLVAVVPLACAVLSLYGRVRALVG